MHMMHMHVNAGHAVSIQSCKYVGLSTSMPPGHLGSASLQELKGMVNKCSRERDGDGDGDGDSIAVTNPWGQDVRVVQNTAARHFPWTMGISEVQLHMHAGAPSHPTMYAPSCSSCSGSRDGNA
jgi:hypothetical protein